MRYTVDLSLVTDKESLHNTMKDALNLPDYYGKNLDALYDLLTEYSTPTTIEFKHWEVLDELGDYKDALMDMLVDVTEENENIEIEISEEETYDDYYDCLKEE